MTATWNPSVMPFLLRLSRCAKWACTFSQRKNSSICQRWRYSCATIRAGTSSRLVTRRSGLVGLRSSNTTSSRSSCWGGLQCGEPSSRPTRSLSKPAAASSASNACAARAVKFSVIFTRRTTSALPSSTACRYGKCSNPRSVT